MNGALTTRQVADACHCSINTIARLCDNGTLKSFRVPNSRHRRVVKLDLLAFMQNEGMPQSFIDEAAKL